MKKGTRAEKGKLKVDRRIFSKLDVMRKRQKKFSLLPYVTVIKYSA